MELTLLWIQLAGAAGVILLAAHFMVPSADAIAHKTGLGRSFVGVVMLATATSLPELGTGVSSILIVGETDLAAGDAFGSNLFNLLIIGLMDLYWRRGHMLSHITPTSALIGILGILVISIAVGAMVVHNLTPVTGSWYVSPMSLLLIGAFSVSLYVIYKAEVGSDTPDHPNDHNGDQPAPPDYEGESLTRAFLIYLATAAIVVGAAIWLATTGDHLSDSMGWEKSFMGTQFLALSTSLPELAASFAALRLGAPDLAIANVLGSNVFNMGFVLFMDDIALTSGVLWLDVSSIHVLTGVIAVVMTAIVVIGIVNGTKGDKNFPISFHGAAMIALYIAASVLVFSLS